MKEILHKLFITCLLICTTLSTYAYDFYVDGIFYNKLSDNTVEVTSNTYEYIGDIVIPATIKYNDVTYTVTSIGFAAFNHCHSLTSITIPNGVNSIGHYAFQDCSGLTSVTIPDGVNSIGDYAFYGCTGLINISFPNMVTTIGNSAFGGCSNLTSIKLPNGLTKIKKSTFRLCSGLTSITIPNEVISIESSAFWDCSGLTSITIGDGVTSIGSSAFLNCKNVNKIVCLRETPPTCGSDALKNISRTDCVLYIPNTSVSDYKKTSPWSEFTNIVNISTDVISAKTQRGVIVSTDGGSICISGAVGGETINVYNATGSLVKSVKAQGDNTVISGLAIGNVYIVKIGGTSVKVVVSE